MTDTERKEVELLPCPFCGQQPEIWSHNASWWVDCRELDCKVNPGTCNSNNKQQAIEQWNKRHC